MSNSVRVYLKKDIKLGYELPQMPGFMEVTHCLIDMVTGAIIPIDETTEVATAWDFRYHKIPIPADSHLRQRKDHE